jgi:hypothetical protein
LHEASCNATFMAYWRSRLVLQPAGGPLASDIMAAVRARVCERSRL